MGSKMEPGKFDCYANAEPYEPMFVLLGRDPMAPTLVRAWAEMRRRNGEPEAVLNEAEACACEMERWLKLKGKVALGTAAVSDPPRAPRSNVDHLIEDPDDDVLHDSARRVR